MKNIIIVLLLALGTLNPISAQEHHDEHEEHHGEHEEHGGGKAIGEGKAILEVHEVKGLKLSDEAISTLEIKLESVKGKRFIINKETLVTSKNLKGIYRFRSGYFKFFPIVILKELNKGSYLIKADDIESNDQIVVHGVGLLRVTDVYSTDKSEYGHAH